VTGLDMGAYHANELTYVFGTSWVFASAGAVHARQRALSDRMMALWADFGQASNFDALAARHDGGRPVKVFEPNEGSADRMDATFFDRHQCAFWDGSSLGAVVCQA
jgi:para-nitrobenzyl esterase